MTIIQFHTPQGIVEVDSGSPTLDEELAALNVTREAFNELLPKPERDYGTEIDTLTAKLKAKGILEE